MRHVIDSLISLGDLCVVNDFVVALSIGYFFGLSRRWTLVNSVG